MGAVISMGGRRIVLPEEFDERRAQLGQMLEIQRGRLTIAQAEAAEIEAAVHRIEGGIVEQDRWLALMSERAQDEKPEGEPAPAGTEEP